ncbi:hypothetical protein ENKO_296 [Klebsiella phage fENko-Kae01]|nr:hypothetical protein [Klebsiella phage fENko-Kae01]
MSTPRFIADTHLGHRNIYKYRKVFDSTKHNDLYFIRILQETCKKRDTMFFLGDICFDKQYLEIIKELPGQKILIPGNHCISPDTEVLTQNGWKVAETITFSDIIASTNLQTNIVSYDSPINVARHENMKMVKVSGSYIDEFVSNTHNMVYENTLTSVSSLYGKHDSNSFKYSCMNSNTGINESDDWIYLLQFVIADGCLVKGETPNKKRIQFKLAKPKKIEKLKSILEKLSISYTIQECKKSKSNILTPYYIRIYGDDARTIWDKLSGIKTPPDEWKFMNKSQMTVWINAIHDSDGYKEINNSYLTTIDKNFVNIFQHACVTNNIACKYSELVPTSGFRNGKLQYKIVFKTIDEYVNSTKRVYIDITDIMSDVVSIQTINGTLITRRNGKVSITGNCTEYIPMKELVDVYDEVHALLKYKEFWLSHAPIADVELRGKRNIHGHVHAQSVPDIKYLNTSVDSEFMRFLPRTLHEVRQAFETMEQLGSHYGGLEDRDDALEVIMSNPISKAAYVWSKKEAEKIMVFQ